MTRQEIMLAVLVGCVVLAAFSFWRAHRDNGIQFNAFDLLMENGKVSKIAVAFMLVLFVSCWVIISQQMEGKLSEGTFGLWLTAWVTPLVAKVVFGKSDMVSTTSTSSSSATTTVTGPTP